MSYDNEIKNLTSDIIADCGGPNTDVEVLRRIAFHFIRQDGLVFLNTLALTLRMGIFPKNWDEEHLAMLCCEEIGLPAYNLKGTPYERGKGLPYENIVFTVLDEEDLKNLLTELNK